MKKNRRSNGQMFSRRNFIITSAGAAGLLASPASIFAQTNVPTSMQKVKPVVTTTRWDSMDLGPFFSGYLIEKSPAEKPQSGRLVALKGISIKLGKPDEAAVCFDSEQMRMAYGWTGGFIKLPVKRDGLEGFSEVVGDKVFSTGMGPGWANKEGSFADPRPRWTEKEPPYGPMPKDWLKWRGLHQHGNQVVLSYAVNGSNVLETPSVEAHNNLKLLTRTFLMEPTQNPNKLLVCQENNATAAIDDKLAILTTGETCTAVALAGQSDGSWEITPEGRLHLKLPAFRAPTTFKVILWNGPKADLAAFKQAVTAAGKLADVKALAKSGAALWTTPVTTEGRLGGGQGPYVVDTITVPEDNPWKSWIRCSGFDFFKDGRAAICSVSGDVWIVSGIDAGLKKLSWKRFATGLFQPLGLKIVDEKVYVLGRDQITRLHDQNNDGEADFYENFNSDVSITPHYHEFCLNLETDSEGNFYYIKGGNLGPAKIPHHGAMIKVSKDGSKLEVFAVGHRAPNGMGMGPNNEITSSDNEGNWVPTSRVSMVEKGGFYGHVHTAHTPTPPQDHDKPIFWLPHFVDNSSGGQVWVTSDKWGPFKGDMLHTSYGKCDLFKVMYERVDGQIQGGVVKFPLRFDSGIMRGRFSPFDGQLYLAGLRVWQSSGALTGAFHRVRYTGQPVHMARDLRVKKNGIEITFTNPLDAELAKDPQNYAVDQWNYLWTKEYGSKMYSVINPEKSVGDKNQSGFSGDYLEIKSIKLSDDKKTVFLEIPNIQPVMQMRIRYNIEAADGSPLRQEIYHTINKVPQA